jgi:hypothetical protein
VILDDTIAALRKQAHARATFAARQGAARVAASLAALGHTAAIEDDRAVLLLAEPEETLPALLRGLIADGLDVFECVATPPTLEDLFLKAVAREEPART